MEPEEVRRILESGGPRTHRIVLNPRYRFQSVPLPKEIDPDQHSSLIYSIKTRSKVPLEDRTISGENPKIAKGTPGEDTTYISLTIVPLSIYASIPTERIQSIRKLEKVP